ncbi:MAG: hypothetical protein LBH76_06080, partial [Propionibacteriaceae bacterium]|nr:hypothetical protein [Propionibacteriaceae bacterium]
AAARARAAGLVVAAADFDTAALAALAANAAAGTMRCLAVRCPDAAALDAAAAATGGAVVSLAALQSGAVRPADLGACATWVSGPDVSWALGLPDRARVSEP